MPTKVGGTEIDEGLYLVRNDRDIYADYNEGIIDQSFLDSLTEEEYEEHLANGGCPYFTPAGQQYYEQYYHQERPSATFTTFADLLDATPHKSIKSASAFVQAHADPSYKVGEMPENTAHQVTPPSAPSANVTRAAHAAARRRMRLQMTMAKHAAALKKYNDLKPPALNRQTSEPHSLSAPLPLKRAFSAPEATEGKADPRSEEQRPLSSNWLKGQEFAHRCELIGPLPTFHATVKAASVYAACKVTMFVNTDGYFCVRFWPLVGIETDDIITRLNDECSQLSPTCIGDVIGPHAQVKWSLVLADVVLELSAHTLAAKTLLHSMKAPNALRGMIKAQTGTLSSSSTSWGLWKVSNLEEDGLLAAKDLKKHEPVFGAMQCGICFDTFPTPRHGAALSACSGGDDNHWCCHQCWVDYLLSNANNRTDALVCPGRVCGQRIGVGEMAALCPDVGCFQKLVRYLCESTTLKHRWCGCGRRLTLRTVEDHPQRDTTPAVYLCECGQSLCSLCGKDGHYGVSCDVSEKYIAAKRGVDAEALSLQYLKRHARGCPKCNFGIERSAGCNHMRCSQCQYYFCWACGGPGTACNAFRCLNGSSWDHRASAAKSAEENVLKSIFFAHRAVGHARTFQKSTLVSNMQHIVHVPELAFLLSQMSQIKTMLSFLWVKRWAGLASHVSVTDKLDRVLTTAIQKCEVCFNELETRMLDLQKTKSLVLRTARMKTQTKHVSVRKQQAIDQLQKKLVQRNNVLLERFSSKEWEIKMKGTHARQCKDHYKQALLEGMAALTLIAVTRKRNGQTKREDLLARKHHFDAFGSRGGERRGNPNPWQLGYMREDEADEDAERIKWKGKGKAKARKAGGDSQY